MLGAIRRALFGANREEQEAFLVRHIYQLSKWLEQTQQVARADRTGHPPPSLAKLADALAVFDRAKASLASGNALPRAEFDRLRNLADSFAREMDAP